MSTDWFGKAEMSKAELSKAEIPLSYYSQTLFNTKLNNVGHDLLSSQDILHAMGRGQKVLSSTLTRPPSQ